jgi:inner membrane protein
MTGRTHDLASITALGVVFVLSGPMTVSLPTALAAVFANLIGGITPDIDQPTAPFWRNLPIGNIFGRMFARMSGGHRFFTHSIIGVVAIGYVARLFLGFLSPILGNIDTGLVWWSFMIGVASHLVMDMFTKEGVPLLLPVPVKFGIPPLKRLRITTGKALENWVVFPLLIVANIVFYSTFHNEVINILRSYIV